MLVAKRWTAPRFTAPQVSHRRLPLTRFARLRCDRVKSQPNCDLSPHVSPRVIRLGSTAARPARSETDGSQALLTLVFGRVPDRSRERLGHPVRTASEPCCPPWSNAVLPALSATAAARAMTSNGIGRDIPGTAPLVHRPVQPRPLQVNSRVSARRFLPVLAGSTPAVTGRRVGGGVR